MAESFSVDTRTEGDICVMTTHGYINNLGGEKISEVYKSAAESGIKKFLVNLEDSKIINSIGVSMLIEVLENIMEADGKLAFCNCVPIVQKTFKIMGITQYATIYETLEAGIEGLS